ncbi:hypothetical protein COCSADRAFT_162129 [Bipolaris sorokiniana ND90Pr]|uniref:Uncharacterized protein n=1 Tax=Cochliobolus sativus (strain ND90Pr / ATCC 201652) TaxID=665912 RepID=M2T0L0_COCSN|nr:uncharacterized protein COCSADRAFT_162129 [Bipolaris sorokiniana ND90Pr]EMD62552.1 hypothetical protein COCSADRAFT_162129 [Bipolaris sorokiniana ND90Pr]
MGGRKVVGIGPHFVVNTINADLSSTGLRVFQNPAQNTTYIVMERIKGHSLDLEWSRMDVATKDAVATQLRNTFRDMRKLSSPGGYCGVDNGGLPDGIFWTSDPSKPFAGPFDSETELDEAMVLKYTQHGL